jgi:hypothetical protein
MKNPLEVPAQQEKYSFLSQTITVLSVDENPREMANFLSALSNIRIFRVLTAQSAKEASSILSDQLVHVCLTELTVNGIDTGTSCFPQKFTGTTRFLAISGLRSCSAGGNAVRCGMAEVIDKPPDFSKVCPIIFRNAMELILSRCREVLKNSAFDRALSVLMVKSPFTVDQWAIEMGVASGTLRELWEKRGIPPKAALFIWRIYQNAFAYFFNRFIFGTDTSKVPGLGESDYRRLSEMFYCKRSYWLNIVGMRARPTGILEAFVVQNDVKRALI